MCFVLIPATDENEWRGTIHVDSPNFETLITNKLLGLSAHLL